MKKAVVYVHGKGGSAAEAAHYLPLFPGHDVIGFDYHSEFPWDAQAEFFDFFCAVSKNHDGVILIANSIGAFFSMQVPAEIPIEKAFFISPVTDMEQLIADMMLWANVTEESLRKQGTVETAFGETLSWEYLCWVRAHPVRWNVPTVLLYGSSDQLQSRSAITAFAERFGAELTVMEGGEHWFHTPEQMAFLDRWITENQ